MAPFLSQTFRAFRSRDYRWLWTGAFVSSVGSWMQKVAQSWLVLTLTGSPFWLGLDAFLADAPFLLFALLGGVMADRHDRRRLLAVSQTVQMLSAFVLGALVATHAVTVGAILVLSFVVGSAQAFGGPAYQALVPLLVPKEDVGNAVALNSIQFNLARIVGPAFAGWAFYRFGAAACFGLNGLSFVAVLIALFFLRQGSPEGEARVESVGASLRTGIAVLREKRALGQLVFLTFAGSFFSVPLLTLLPVVARDVFHADAGGYSRFLSVFGAGAVTGGLLVAALDRVKGRGRNGLLMQVVFGVLTISFALCRVERLSLVLLFFAGAALMAVFPSFMTLVQTIAPEEVRGRVVSIYVLAFRGGMPIGSLVAGSVASAVGAPVTIAVSGLAVSLLAVAFLLRKDPEGVASLA